MNKFRWKGKHKSDYDNKENMRRWRDKNPFYSKLYYRYKGEWYYGHLYDYRGFDEETCQIRK